MWLLDTAYSATHNKCPRCHKGAIFTEKNPYKLGKIFSMHRTCSHCGLIYEKEVSFFYGAMYISYGLMVLLFVVLYVMQNLFLNWDLGYFVTFVAILGVCFSPLNFRLARIIWLNIFFRFEKERSLT